MNICRLLFLFWFAFLLIVSSHAQRRNSLYVEYINQYKELAMEQMKIYRIPASITLSQGLLESGAGRGTLAKKANNHFGIKCGNWRGKTVKHTDDAHNECFRAYRNVRDSYVDHSKFLTSNARYAFLFKLDVTDYKGWARGLKKAGYATDRSYANRLIQIIEDYELYKYDSKNRRRKGKKAVITSFHQVYLANGLLYVIAKHGDSFQSIAKEFGTKARKLIKYNDLHKEYTLAPDDIIYLREKNKKAAKPYTVHVVGEGDSMHSISQRYGIRVKNLYKMNHKDPDEYIPEVGDRLRLR